MASYINGVKMVDAKFVAFGGKVWFPASQGGTSCDYECSVNGGVCSDAYFTNPSSSATVKENFDVLMMPKCNASCKDSGPILAEVIPYRALGPFLEFYWDFRNAQEDTIVDHIGGITAQIDSSTLRTTTGLVFGSKSTVLLFGNTVLGGAMTFEIITKLSAFHNHDRLFIFGGFLPGYADDIFLKTQQEGQLVFWVNDETGKGRTVGSRNPVTNEPFHMMLGIRYHITATVSATSMVIYVNGVKHGSDTSNPSPKIVPRVVQRKSSSLGGGSDSEISSFKIYFGAMTDTQVNAAYEAAFPFLEFFWNFTGTMGGNSYTDSVKGIVATMRSGNGGALPQRTTTGVVMVGTGATSSTANKGGFLELALGTQVTGGPMTVELVIKWSAFNWWSRLFDCGNGESSDNIVVAN